MITISNVSFLYKQYERAWQMPLDVLLGINVPHTPRWVLRDINLTIGRGERVGLIGRNGAGKSTLCRIVIGSLIPHSGTCQVEGRAWPLFPGDAGWAHRMTGRENVDFQLLVNGFEDNAERARRASSVFTLSGLNYDTIDRPLVTYSDGQFARLMFAATTEVNAEIFVIDEILGAVDAGFAEKARLRVSEKTVLFVSHDLDEVARLCTRAVWLDNGRIVMDGSVDDVIAAYSRSFAAAA